MTSAGDSVNGNWVYGYNALDQLTSSACAVNSTSSCPDGTGAESFAYAYDRYGNRWAQTVTSGSGPAPSASFTGANNRMTGYSCDASGDLLNDGAHSYGFDAGHRIASVDGRGRRTEPTGRVSLGPNHRVV